MRKTLTNLLNLFNKEGWYGSEYQEEWVEAYSERLNVFINEKVKPFLQWLIDNWHIEEIKSEKKSWPDLNDYIKYIAETEDPVKTLVGMLK